jgi:hypothetical protein
MVRVAVRLGVFALATIATACGGGSPAPALDTFVLLGDFQPAALVFGQPIFAFGEANQGLGEPGADRLAGPGKPAVAGHYLPDEKNNRVLCFEKTPIISNLSASFVLGQPGFNFGGAAVGATAMNAPVCAAVGDGRLFVAERGNDRVLVWNVAPTRNGVPADFALGQPDMITRGPTTSAGGLSRPMSVAAAGGRLAIADSGNHRVLVWEALPSTSGAPADAVIGQSGFASSLENMGIGTGPDSLLDPCSVWTDGLRLVVADRGNHRVLIWHSIDAIVGRPADVVLGQPDFNTAAAGAGPSGMRHPSDVTSNGVQLFVADAGNHRILVWNVFPDDNGAPADRVIGQGDFQATAPNDDDQDGVEDATCSARTLKSADNGLSLHVTGDRLFVGDPGNNRLLIFRGR